MPRPGSIIIKRRNTDGVPNETDWLFTVHILLTNDDGIYAPGLAAMERELRRLGEVWVVAPATEQSGVGHSVTFLSPLICNDVYDGERRRGWSVEGSPADCVKIGVEELCPRRPDLVVSGINGGLNVGINVLYSGTVAAAIEGAFFQIPSVAVSLEYDENPRFDRAASLARGILEQILEKTQGASHLFNINLPTAATQGQCPVRVVPMGVVQYGERYLKRTDPRGRTYYWATGDPPPTHGDVETDLTAIERGCITVTPLHFDLTKTKVLEQMKDWNLQSPPPDAV